MSLYGVLRTGVSGMSAQSSKLGTISENIANTGTAGYKRASTEFSSLILDSGQGEYQSGAVDISIRHAISAQGALARTTSATDLAIEGSGFFIVSGQDGQTYLTRAGSFVVDASTGNLVNAAGFTLMGYDIGNGDPNVLLNGVGGLRPVNLDSASLQAKPSTNGIFEVNLPADAAVVAGPTPAANVAGSVQSEKSSILAYDNVGNQVTLDIYMTKTAANPPTWEMSVFDQATAPAAGGFPYAAGPLTTQTITFDGSGQLTGGSPLTLAVPNGQTLTLDLGGTTQLAADYTPIKVSVDGSEPSNVSGVSIGDDGVVSVLFANGSRGAVFRIPLADVGSPDQLQPSAGNVFSTTIESGAIQIGFPTEIGLGRLASGALEQSNVDMATELTEMIVAQRDYTANSKVFQTGSELLDVLMNLKR